MDYTELVTMLQCKSPDYEVTTFPDDSIDTYSTIYNGDDQLNSRVVRASMHKFAEDWQI